MRKYPSSSLRAVRKVCCGDEGIEGRTLILTFTDSTNDKTLKLEDPEKRGKGSHRHRQTDIHAHADTVIHTVAHSHTHSHTHTHTHTHNHTLTLSLSEIVISALKTACPLLTQQTAEEEKEKKEEKDSPACAGDVNVVRFFVGTLNMDHMGAMDSVEDWIPISEDVGVYVFNVQNAGETKKSLGGSHLLTHTHTHTLSLSHSNLLHSLSLTFTRLTFTHPSHSNCSVSISSGVCLQWRSVRVLSNPAPPWKSLSLHWLGRDSNRRLVYRERERERERERDSHTHTDRHILTDSQIHAHSLLNALSSPQLNSTPSTPLIIVFS